jgi:hypothetical protein
MRRLVPALALSASLLAACATDPANVAGTFSVNLTNRDNGCNLANWTVGATASGIPVTITQSGAMASADVGGGARVVLDLFLAGHVYSGTVDATKLSLDILGTRSATMGNCTYTYNSELRATLTGDALAGTITYKAATNGNPDCATLTGCVSTEDFNGARPPQ